MWVQYQADDVEEAAASVYGYTSDTKEVEEEAANEYVKYSLAS